MLGCGGDGEEGDHGPGHFVISARPQHVFLLIRADRERQKIGADSANQTIVSQSEFYFSLLAVFDENATSLFAYDYADSPPSPFFSIYLSPSNETIHVDVEE